MLAVLQLTGYLRNSAYHHPPFHFESGPSGEDWRRWGRKGANREEALEQALRTGNPIQDPPCIHPEQSLLRYPGTGRDIGRMVGAMATGRSTVLPLQLSNQGAIHNFPDDVCVEVPTQVRGRAVTPQSVGELPEWLGGVTRLFAIQRRMLVDYLLDPSLAQLKQALSVLPILGPVERHVRFAETLHGIASRSH